MGLFDFIRNTGENLFGGKKESAADKIRERIEKDLGANIEGLGVLFDDGRVELHGTAKSQAAKEKATLIAGNVQGVSAVSDDGLRVAGQPAQEAEAEAAAEPEPTFYTIEKGDTLSAIAKRFYGDANKYHALFEANREVIKDPDKIYPGQQIRVPKEV